MNNFDSQAHGDNEHVIPRPLRLALAVALLCFCSCFGRRPNPSSEEMDRITLTSLRDNTQTTLGAEAGKVTIVNLFATWCHQCKFEVIALNRLFQKFRDRGLRVIAIPVEDQTTKVTEFLEDNAISLPVFLDSEEKLMSKSHAFALPHTFVWGCDGKKDHYVATEMQRRDHPEYQILEWDGVEGTERLEALLSESSCKN